MLHDNNFSLQGFVVWVICALFFLYEFFLRTIIGTFQNPLMQDLQLNSFEFSLLSTTVFFFIYGLMQIPAGFAVDRYGLKKTLLAGSTICAGAALAFANAPNYSVAFICRLMMGFGASVGFIGLLVSVYDWMPRRYIALLIGVSQFIGTLGPMLAAGPISSLVEGSGIGWRSIFTYLGVMGITLAVLILFFVKNNDSKTGNYIILTKPEKLSDSIKRLFHRLQPWYIALYSVTTYFAIEYLSENEGRIFLSLKGIEINSAAYILSISWFGYAVGCPLLGSISDYFSRRKTPMIIAGALTLLSMLIIVYAHNQIAITIAFFLLGVGASGQSVGFASIAEQFKKQFVAIGFGLNNAIISTVGAINAPVIGLYLDYLKEGSEPSLQDYQTAFIALIVIGAISLFSAAFLIKETFCKSEIDFTYLKVK